MDIWALGCIIHELALDARPFFSDWATKEFFNGTEKLELCVPFPAFFAYNLNDILNSLLERDWTLRPRASDICVIFLSCCQLFRLGLCTEISKLDAFDDLYSKWKLLALTTPDDWKVFTLFLDVISPAKNLDPEQQAEMEALYSSHLGSSLEDCRTRISLDQGNYQEAINTYNCKIKDVTQNLRMWHILFAMQAATVGLEGANTLAMQHLKSDLTNPCVNLVLATLYIANGDYTMALKFYTDIFHPRVAEKSKNLGAVIETMKRDLSSYLQKRSNEVFKFGLK